MCCSHAATVLLWSLCAMHSATVSLCESAKFRVQLSAIAWHSPAAAVSDAGTKIVQTTRSMRNALGASISNRISCSLCSSPASSTGGAPPNNGLERVLSLRLLSVKHPTKLLIVATRKYRVSRAKFQILNCRSVTCQRRVQVSARPASAQEHSRVEHRPLVRSRERVHAECTHRAPEEQQQHRMEAPDAVVCV